MTPVFASESPSAMPSTHAVVEKLRALQTELVEQAFLLDRQGRREAADVAMATSARLEEFCEALIAEQPRDPQSISRQNHS